MTNRLQKMEGFIDKNRLYTYTYKPLIQID